MKDIFLCHASEDKEEVVRPLFQAMTDANISCWLDEAEIHWGDSITQKVNEGLTESHYIIVVLSQAFLDKKWPQRELNAVLNREASTGEVRVLPLLVGDQATKTKIMSQFALINDKLYLPWDGSTGLIVDALLKRLDKMKLTGDRSTLSAIASQPRKKQPFFVELASKHSRIMVITLLTLALALGLLAVRFLKGAEEHFQHTLSKTQDGSGGTSAQNTLSSPTPLTETQDSRGTSAEDKPIAPITITKKRNGKAEPILELKGTY